MIKKVVFVILLFLSFTKAVYADYYCNADTVKQVAKIVYKEIGADLNKDPAEDFFGKLVTASVILNNASGKVGDTFEAKLLNLTNNNYQGYSTYKYNAFENVVDASLQNKMLYIAELVLTGQFNVPKEMYLQASKGIVEQYGTVWAYVPSSYGGYIDTYFGYPGTLSNTDIFGNVHNDTSPEYYRLLAASLMKNDYSSYTVSTICSHEKEITDPTPIEPTPTPQPTQPTNPTTPTNPTPSPQRPMETVDIEICEDPSILRALYIIKMLIIIIKIITPVMIILTGIISMTKALFEGDGNFKNEVSILFQKIIIGVMIFFIPTVVSTFLKFVNFKVNSFDYNKCYDNANITYIKQAEAKK